MIAGEKKTQTDILSETLYRELHKRAQLYLRRERPGHTLSPTALIHEAYIELSSSQQGLWQNRDHFLGVAALAMRRVLSTHARSRNTAKRQGRNLELELSPELLDGAAPYVWDYGDLDRALEDLEAESPDLAAVGVCRFFGGMSVEETGRHLNISPATVKRRWMVARAWLHRRMTASDESPA